MKKTIFSIIFVLAFFVSLQMYALNNNATVYKLKGEAYFKTGKSDWKKLEIGTKLDAGDEIFTGIRSVVLIQLEDKTKLLVDSLTHFKFAKLKIEKPGAAGSSNVSLSLNLGSLSANVTRGSGMDKSFGVSTPAGTASVRGTKKVVRYAPDKGMDVNVLSGVVDVVSSLNRSLSVSSGSTTSLNSTTGATAPTNVVSQSYTPSTSASSIVQEQARELSESFFDASNLQFATEFFSDLDLQKL